MRTLLVWLLRGYRFAISPLYGQVCRYHPSCSSYALEAVQTHGAARGSWLTLRRLGRCHPWAAGGVDHVPGSERERRYLEQEREDDAPGHRPAGAHRHHRTNEVAVTAAGTQGA